MPPAFDVFVVVVALVALGAVIVSWRRGLTPAWRGWQLGMLLMVGGQALPATARLVGASPDVVRLAALVRVVLLVPVFWLLWRHRSAVFTSPRSRA